MTDTDDAARFRDFNQGVIDEFRANDGIVGGPMKGFPLILVNHRGAKSGTVYTAPLVYTSRDQDLVIIASKGGAPEDPQWFRNLVAHPEVTVEVGSETIAVRARVAEGAERDELFRAQADAMPNFDEYQANTDRTIPVVVLERT